MATAADPQLRCLIAYLESSSEGGGFRSRLGAGEARISMLHTVAEYTHTINVTPPQIIGLPVPLR